ncbi:DUF421 domain-containing protein [Pleomorphovibrio marinus]|uniref:DUF421 domain-containing protein n=1 Tax=Pleomorphovibrio marinus TaxID=2164132 RepID=UPI000E0A6C75|nr:YetF domain-containing protein [Pleomorphovibrio marinus]
MEHLLFENWQSLFRTFVITILAYFCMVTFLRAFGKRTLSKMNAFDFIVTVALGSTLAAVALNKDIPLADGALAFFLFISLQFVITWLSVRFKAVKNIVTSQPTLLLFKGELISENVKKERITVEEIHLSAREKGFQDLKQVDVMVLETTGEITVLGQIDSGNASALKGIQSFER